MAAVMTVLVTGPTSMTAAAWAVSLAGGSAGQAAAGTLVAPTGVTGTCGTGPNKTRVTVSWTAAPQAGSYTLLRSSTSATTGFSTVATGVTATTWTSPDLTPGSYWFTVVTVRGNWSSAASTATAQHTITSNSCS